MRAWAIAAGLACAAPGLAQAQAPAQAQGSGGDYAANLAALSEVLGEAHYIRRLCYGRADQQWRNQMMRFMDLEGPPGTPQRKMMSDGFNDGYRQEEQRFAACTPEAQDYETALKAKGAHLASALAARHRE